MLWKEKVFCKSNCTLLLSAFDYGNYQLRDIMEKEVVFNYLLYLSDEAALSKAKYMMV